MSEPLVIRAPEGDASRHSEGHQVRVDGRLWQVHQGQWVRVPEPESLLARHVLCQRMFGTSEKPASSKSYAAGGNGAAI
jgi:hypothetical protein